MSWTELEIVFKAVFLAWFIVELDPLQKGLEYLAEKSGFFNVSVYAVASCWYCLSFWGALICLVFKINIPSVLVGACVAAFIAFYTNKILNSSK
jgi:hypothetical protein